MPDAPSPADVAALDAARDAADAAFAAAATPALAMAARLVLQMEGMRLAPYQDQAGVWTIGAGTIAIGGQPVTAHTPPITEAEAYRLMMDELRDKAARVDAGLSVPATDHQRAALYSFTYNEGVAAFLYSDIRRLFNAGDTAGAAAAFANWRCIHVNGALVIDKGLTRRRSIEAAVFLGRITP